ncbi:hypothetical protein BC777_2299 [Yoonia maricola]|uniref:Uncharacterized protein n=1 Tax=Yoonia maricola TaxID=420999 RepID=A0A2M8W4W2_9RHOB|nr:hypothetical protein BC777_2299 [Yoonia maricola]
MRSVLCVTQTDPTDVMSKSGKMPVVYNEAAKSTEQPLILVNARFA